MSDNPKMFIAVVASGFGMDSQPIEIAWVHEDGTTGSLLIRYEGDGVAWDVLAADQHGLTQRMLDDDGSPTAAAAMIISEALEGHDLFSASGIREEVLLANLLGDATPRIMPISAAYTLAAWPLRMLHPLMRAREMAATLLMHADIDAADDHLERGRAVPNARRLFDTWRLLRDGVAACG